MKHIGISRVWPPVTLCGAKPVIGQLAMSTSVKMALRAAEQGGGFTRPTNPAAHISTLCKECLQCLHIISFAPKKNSPSVA